MTGETSSVEVRAYSLPAAADLYGDLQPHVPVQARDYLPGLAVTLCASLAAGYLSDHYGAPLTLMALLIGLALNFLSEDKRLAPGLAFASGWLLRVGIVLVGARITAEQVAELGWPALLAVLGIVSATLCTGMLIARRLGFSRSFGILAGGAVAICGASAAMAIAGVIGTRKDQHAELTFVLVGVAALSAFGMFAYPIIAHYCGMDNLAAGFLLGASIHDVAQALGAGYAYSDAAGQTATIVKLTRVAMLAPVLAIVSLLYRTKGSSMTRTAPVPWFVVGFFILAAVNSFGLVPSRIGSGANMLATGLLACAVTATGIRAPLRALIGQGARSFLVIAGTTAMSLLLSLLVALFVIG